jgi:hypothetical protein
MFSSPGSIVPLTALTPLGNPVGADILPIQRTSPMQSVTAEQLQGYIVNSVKYYGAVGDGITDDTGAIQSAINTGLPFYFPPGVYLITQTLRFTTTANHGQVVRGSGPVATDGSGAGKAVIRPGAGVSIAIQIDGSPFNGYVQGFGLEDLTVDMVNMGDDASSVGILQAQAFDIEFKNIRVINYGVYKTSFQFNAGSYTSNLNHCQFGSVNFNGATPSNAATTISFYNCDFLTVGGNYHAGVSFVGGACQQPYTDAVSIIYLPPGTSPYAYLPNNIGIYVALLSTIQNCNSFTSIGTDWEQGGGFPSTYNDGIHGVLPLIRVLMVAESAQNSTFISPTFAGMYLLDMSKSTSIDGQNVGTGGADIRTRQLYCLGGLNVSAPIQGFTDLANYLNTNSTRTFTLNPDDGSGTFMTMQVNPVIDGDGQFVVRNASAQPLFDFSTVGGAGILAINYGAIIAGFTDGFTTQSWTISSSNGLATFAGSVIKPVSDGNSVQLWKNAAGTVLLGFNTDATPASSSLYLENGITLNGFSDGGITQTWSASASTGNVTAKSLQVGATAPIAGGITTNGQIRTVGNTFSSLPTPSTIGNGARGFITDATLAAAGNFGTPITSGGGSNQVPVYSDGTNWRIG